MERWVSTRSRSALSSCATAAGNRSKSCGSEKWEELCETGVETPVVGPELVVKGILSVESWVSRIIGLVTFVDWRGVVS